MITLGLRSVMVGGGGVHLLQGELGNEIPVVLGADRLRGLRGAEGAAHCSTVVRPVLCQSRGTQHGPRHPRRVVSCTHSRYRHPSTKSYLSS